MTARHIAVLTGKRGGYGAMKPMLKLIEADPDLKLSLIVTDQHVNPKFGATIAEVEKDFKVAAVVDLEQSDGTGFARARAIGMCLSKLSEVLDELRPHILLLYGDRGEVMAAAIAALHLGIPVAHVQGGDISGNMDELFRHAMTKLSHLHFPSNQESAGRILGLGEEPWRVHVVGDNHIDQIVASDFTDAETLWRRYGISPGEKPILVLQHPETTRNRDNYADMRATLQAVLVLGRRTLVIYPCSDQGYEEVVRAIEEVRGFPGVSIHLNIEAPDFWGLLSMAAVLVGNSSAGLIETPYFRIPAIDLGQRQMGRLRAENVISSEFGKEAVAACLEKALYDQEFAQVVQQCSQPFGDGQAFRRIVAILKTIPLDENLLNKRITY
jgi:GDP/UDP-N,N'-diacetylbacillosamine 2-epimerase (hydrolysing)